MQHREEWEDLDEADGWALLRQAIASKPVDWAEISDVLWWAREKDEEGGDVMLRYVDYLGHHLREHAASGGGWYAGQRKTWLLDGVEFVMRWIPAGRFLMGSGVDDSEAWDDEKPQREVKITRGFWMGETPVTQAQYQSIMGENPSYFRGSGLDVPVEGVTWHKAAAFTNKLSEIEGVSACFVDGDPPVDPRIRRRLIRSEVEILRGVGDDDRDYLRCAGWRLPTEAEWEYACRAGTTTPRYGNLDDIAWYAGNSRGGAHLVGQKEPNAWGLHDTLGNVWEWVYDAISGYAEMSTIDPLRTNGGEERVIRGGGWGSGAGGLRSASRSHMNPLEYSSHVGFRIVRGVP